jgi:hypothetical protein
MDESVPPTVVPCLILDRLCMILYPLLLLLTVRGANPIDWWDDELEAMTGSMPEFTWGDLPIIFDDRDDMSSDSSSVSTTEEYIRPDGILDKIPARCARAIHVSSPTKYASVLEQVIRNKVVPHSFVDTLTSQGVNRGDTDFESLRSALWRFQRRMEVSPDTLDMMLEWNRMNMRFKSFPVPVRCATYVWYYFVVNPAAREGRDALEIETTISDAVKWVIRPTGSALVGLIKFELNRLVYP